MIKIARLLTLLLLPSAFLWGCDNSGQKDTQHNISIKVAIIYNLGGTQAVAREGFNLLSKDAVQIGKQPGW